MEGDEDPWSEEELSVSGNEMAGKLGAADRFGWKAMPFARDDLDSNCKEYRG